MMMPTRRASYEWYKWLYDFCHRVPPKPTEAELRIELERLTPAEQVELLALMEQQAQEPPPERLTDDRPSFDELLAELRDEYAAKSADPSAFRTAWDRHEEATRQHFEKLEAENPPPLQGNELVSDPVGAWFLATIEKAHELAEADGFRDPSAKPTPPPAPPDPLGAALRASLPRPTWVDIEESKVRTAESTTYERIVADQDDDSRLLPYRDKSPSTQPPSWPDS